MQSQLDELARGLIEAFSEKNITTTDGEPRLPGLFTWNGAIIDDTTTPPTADTIPTAYTPGLANLIQVNKEVIIVEGGQPKRIRDGGINGTDYVANGTAATGYSQLIKSRIDALDADMVFDSGAQIETNTSILEYATNSMGWMEQVRKAAVEANETKSASYQRVSEAYSNGTGVSLDEELSLLLDIEQSYKAAAKLVSTVDEMLSALMNMVR